MTGDHTRPHGLGMVSFGRKITRIVYMGMGEPLFNYDNVIQSIHILRDRNGLNFPTDGITLSTTGPLDRLKRLREEHLKRAHFYTLLTGVCTSCGAYSLDNRKPRLFCVTSFRTRGCTPCDVCTSIPCGFAVRKQHKMLFAASKFESD